MQFIQQHEKGEGNWGTVLLTLSISLGAAAVGGLVSGILMALLGIHPDSIEIDKNLLLFFMIVPFAFLICALLLCIKWLHKRPIWSLFTARERFDWKRLLFAFGSWMFVLITTLFIGMAFGQPVEWNVNWSTFFPLLLVSFLMLPLQTAAEDLLFRGYLLQSFHQWFGKPLLSILFSGALFGLVHMGNPEIAKIGELILIYYVAVGIFLALITHLDNGLELGMGYHAANNIFAALVVTNNWQAFQTDALFIDYTPPSFGWDIIISLVLVHPLLLIVFSKVFKWNNWSRLIR